MVESLKHKGMKEPAARQSRPVWQVLQVCNEASVPLDWKRQRQGYPDYVSERLLCLGFPASPWFTASCRDGSLAVIQPLWIQSTAGKSSALSSSDAHGPNKIAGKNKEGSCSVVCASSPMLVSRDHNFRSESVYQTRKSAMDRAS